jgi:hypothetical protein
MVNIVGAGSDAFATFFGSCPISEERFPSRCSGEALLHRYAADSGVVTVVLPLVKLAMRYPKGASVVWSQYGSGNTLSPADGT